MPTGTHTKDLDVSIERIWDFVKDMDKWAPLVPGYIEHDILNERQSTWVFKGDIGIMQKTVKLKIDITEWIEPTRVTFKLSGLNENFSGNGYFEAESLPDHTTKMIGNLDITAGGMMGPMINAILKSFVPKTAEELTEAIGNKIIEIETVKGGA
ncbi:CoxG family protein [Bacillus sp. S/N-304-OC-R1]|uniref:CoxG family protein n=1 Tax=Bacillus sp. S/N-304-OC-R1 TaxID=2758034 RepID=UPI001C8F1CDB|nr:SRPBCC family protein [Bacillus sp. S/N-304-OC-R1]MBY0121773.1 SRPBCC family protein [Bacillus sp. S/N-304-OC-R1]